MEYHNFELTEERDPRHRLNVGHPSFIQSNMGTLPGWFCMPRHPANTAIAGGKARGCVALHTYDPPQFPHILLWLFSTPKTFK